MKELPELIDSHCHLEHGDGIRPPAELIREANDAGVRVLINVCTELKDIEKLEALSKIYSQVYHTVGVHPHEAKDLAEEDVPRLNAAARNPKCVAVGEIGLDYHYDHSPRDIQQRMLGLQLEAAVKAEKPVVIHSRDAEADLLESLRKYCSKFRGRIPGVIHCFTGTESFGKSCIEMGFYISFSGILTFKNADDLRSCARVFPLGRLLVETDSPFLAPIPFRGKKCEPSMVTFTALKLAEIKGISIAELAQATTENAKHVFGV